MYYFFFPFENDFFFENVISFFLKNTSSFLNEGLNYKKIIKFLSIYIYNVDSFFLSVVFDEFTY